MYPLAGACLAGRHPAGPVHRCAGARRRAADRRPHAGAEPSQPWLSIVPIAESRSCYNGLLVLVFMTSLGVLAALRDPPPRVRPAAARTAPGIAAIPTRPPPRNTPLEAFAQPIRRVFGTLIFPARETGRDAAAGLDRAGAAHASELRDLIWGPRYAPIAEFVGYAATRLNRAAVPDHPRLPRPLVFAALVLLLLVLAI